METSKSGSAPKPAWGKRIGIFLGVLMLLLVAGFFVATSSGFLKAVVLPKVGAAINARVTAESISLSPFSQIEIQGLKVETTGSEPLLTSQKVRVRYALMDIIKGNINVDEVTLESPVIQVIQQADGSSNLDPILKKDDKGAADDGKKQEPMRLSVKNVSLKNGTVKQVQKLALGGANTTEIQNLDIALDRLGNQQSGKLTLSAALTMEQRNGATNDVLKATISGGYDFGLNQELLPQTITGSTKLNVSSGQGAFADLAGFTGSLDADLTPKELRKVALVFTKNNQRLGEVRASGPLDLDRREGNLRIEILSLDKNAFALATAGKGMDFRQSEINSTNQITISQGGTFFAASGNLAGAKISVTQGAMNTPEMDLSLDYQATINTGDRSAVLQKLSLNGSYGGRDFLHTSLDRQMNLSWGEAVKGYKDAALNLTVTNFNLADWRPVLGTNVSAGVVQATLALVAQQDGKILKTELAARVNGLSAMAGTNQLRNADVAIDLSGTVEQMKIVNISKYTVAIVQGGLELLQANGAARYEMANKDAKAQITARADLARLLALAPMTNLTAREGKVEMSGNFSDSGGNRKAIGSVSLNGFTGRLDRYDFQKFQATFEYNFEADARRVEIHRMAATFSEGFNAGGSIDAKGRYDLEEKSGQITFRTVDLNQNTFRTFLAPSLGANELVSMSVNASGEATLNPKGENAIKANFKVGNWVVKDSAGTFPKSPLAAELTVDAGMRQETVDLRDLGLKLSPTLRAKNELNVKGKIDFAKSNAAPSSLAIHSESLDLTPYYDMFAGGTNVTKTSTNTPAAKPGPEKEPAPVELPFRQMAVDLKIDRLYLREIAISNWTAQLTMRTNVLEVRPFKLDLNGGSMTVSAAVNTGVTGYGYDIGFQAGGVPLQPMVDTFSPGLSNQLAGNFIADARITGAGVTGAGLRKNLSGQLMFNLTNLNYEVVGPKLRRILVPISIALRVPELTATPLNWVSAQTQIGKGTVALKHLGVQSEAFYAESAGPIELADILTNSVLNLPLELSLRRSLAEKARLLPDNVPADAKYAKLPQFATVKGTLGAPDVDLNKLVLAGVVAKGAAGLGLTFGNEKAEQALGAIGNLLTGQKASTNNASTNAASTNASPAQSLLQGLGGLLGGPPAATNQPAAKTNAPATNPPARLNPFDLLKALPQKQAEPQPEKK